MVFCPYLSADFNTMDSAKGFLFKNEPREDFRVQDKEKREKRVPLHKTPVGAKLTKGGAIQQN